MWNLLKKSDEECRKLQDLLEGSSSARPEAVPVEELSQAWPAAQRAHVAACRSCREAAAGVFAARGNFKGAASSPQGARAWVVARVIAAISALGMVLLYMAT